MKFISYFIALLTIFLPTFAYSAGSSEHESLDLTNHLVGYLALIVFVLAYALVIFEEQLHLRKSKPVLLAAGIIWVMIAIVYQQNGFDHAAEIALRHNFLEYSELFFFLLVAMTYINAMIERGVFDALRGWLVRKGFSYKSLFWLLGVLAFFISPVADNLTTALIMCTVALTVGAKSPKFVAITCVGIVVGANAGGAFSPFGDITTLMVWQKGRVDFTEFFVLFVPSLVNYIIPAAIMHFFVPEGTPDAVEGEEIMMKRGGISIVILFLLTIATAVSFHNFLHLPPAIGMMTGLAYLKFYGYYLKKTVHEEYTGTEDRFDEAFNVEETTPQSEGKKGFDIFAKVAGAEWDTLFFFYGVIMAVGGLGFIGYLGMVSEAMYGQLGPTTANVIVGVLSAIVDNIPVMFAVLTMNPEMSHGQWLLVTLTAGVGGSLLSIGSAAGVALMGQARGIYTFASHLKWAPVIALGYIASIYTHLWINASHF
ncbi:MAG: sodium:proton antiporter NhaD [Cycloclasticus sp.]